MARYIAQRLLYAIPVFFAVLTIIFVVVRVIPGDPATVALGDYASKESVDALREKMGLNKPLYLQYTDFIDALLHGDLGHSMITGTPVRDMIAHVFPYSIELMILGILIGSALGLPFGAYAAIRRNRLADYFSRIISLAGLSVPAFYLGILLVLLFAVRLRLLPAVGGGDLTNVQDNASHLILPAFTLGLVMTASVARLSRSAMLNVLGVDYVRTARAKGLREIAVLTNHALRSALIPIVSLIGIWAINLIGDSVTTEIIFARPGLGSLMVGSIFQRDYIALQSIMVCFAGIVVLINLSVDLIYGLVDPRVRH